LNFQYTILIVETDRTLGLLYQIEFEELGYRVVVANSGNTAVEKVHSSSPDLVLLDPGTPGENLQTSILHINPVLPIIFHTTFPPHGASDNPEKKYICKSSDLTELKKLVFNTLQER